MNRDEKSAVFGDPGVEAVHLVGIGGAGMNVLAQILISLGLAVTGSDLRLTPITDRLARRGARIVPSHRETLPGRPDLLVYSSAILPQNPELVRGRELGIPIIHRSDLLAGLMRLKRGIAVAGSHGKTTTAALIAWILVTAGRKPALALGGEAIGLEDHPGWDEGDLLLAEADESDGSLQRLSPQREVITGLDLDHIDYYSSWEKLILTFAQFTERLPPGGSLVIQENTPHLHRLVRSEFRTVTYGLDEASRIRAVRIRYDRGGSRFSVLRGGWELGEVHLSQLGLCSVINSLGAIALCLEEEVPFGEIARALETFPGVRRRLEIKSRDPVLIVEDYAHHPVEVAAALAAVRQASPGKIHCVFQPHRYSRTEHFARDLAESLQGADTIILADLYPAFERPISGVSSELLLQALRGLGRTDGRLLRREAIRPFLEQETTPGDAVVIMGAGDIGTLAGELATTWSPGGRRRGEEIQP